MSPGPVAVTQRPERPEWWRKLRLRLLLVRVRLKRLIPRLVWYGDEVDVVVSFTEDRINQNDPLGSLWRGRLPEIERALSEIGVRFDTGLGLNGRDWEWDYSLRGPISVKFKRRAAQPGRRGR